ncbi:MAG: hypothetical protein QOD71_429 [Thermoleophilaceae bacterium]|jgi:DNA-directed RNA polymerase specialized sigma24 family protein|nr:hypothetical protein [Thermoleophilaceae bacterium]
MTDPSAPTTLDEAAAELVHALQDGQQFALASLAVLQRELTRRLAGQDLGADTVEELVDQVVVRFVQAVRRGRPIRPDGSGAYIARSLRNAAVDYHRAPNQVLPFEEEIYGAMPLDDDQLARLLAKHAARADVLDGLEAAVADQRYTVVKVVLQWLRLAERFGEEPSSRQVGLDLDLSHTAVNDALSEFRERYLPNPAPDP